MSAGTPASESPAGAGWEGGKQDSVGSESDTPGRGPGSAVLTYGVTRGRPPPPGVRVPAGRVSISLVINRRGHRNSTPHPGAMARNNQRSHVASKLSCLQDSIDMIRCFFPSRRYCAALPGSWTPFHSQPRKWPSLLRLHSRRGQQQQDLAQQL